MKSNISQIFDFLHLMKDLKTTKRFKDSPKMPRPTESVSDHTWRLVLMVMLFVDELDLKIDELKAMKIAIVHDITETITDDVDYSLICQGKVTKEEKHKQEVEAIKKIRSMLPKKIGKEIYDLWLEYENKTSQEAKFIKALDKMETLTTVLEAGHKCYSNPKATTLYAGDHINNYPELEPVYNELKKRLTEEMAKMGYKWE